jgi:hypothetical protein
MLLLSVTGKYFLPQNAPEMVRWVVRLAQRLSGLGVGP